MLAASATAVAATVDVLPRGWTEVGAPAARTIAPEAREARSAPSSTWRSTPGRGCGRCSSPAATSTAIGSWLGTKGSRRRALILSSWRTRRKGWTTPSTGSWARWRRTCGCWVVRRSRTSCRTA
eukprot:g16223.t1